MEKLNCWEYKKCGREPEGKNVHLLGVCPATREVRLHGTHHGKNGGRACWVVAGSLCGGRVQGTFAQKFKNCSECEFYRLVKSEEMWNFELSAVLLGKVTSLGNRKREHVSSLKNQSGAGDTQVKKEKKAWWRPEKQAV